MNPDNTIIRLNEISKKFNAGLHNEVNAVRDVSLSINANQCTVLKGPSGSGKTTLLAIIGCLSKPSSGNYICLNENVSHWSEKFLTNFRRQHIGTVFQNFNLISGLTALQNIALPLLPAGYSVKEINNYVYRVSELVNIHHRLEFKIDTLSGGEQQRVALARALVNDPDILIADEPTSHLDTDLSHNILDLFAKLKASGKTLLIATHDPLVENHSITDTVICMRDGILGESDAC
jgi:putative ABC transport system ATP-binding protein